MKVPNRTKVVRGERFYDGREDTGTAAIAFGQGEAPQAHHRGDRFDRRHGPDEPRCPDGHHRVSQTSDLKTTLKKWLDQPGHPHVAITWKYDADKKAVLIDFTLTGHYQFPLEYTIDGTPYRVDIHDQHTHIELPFPEKPTTLIPDPNINLLADFETNG